MEYKEGDLVYIYSTNWQDLITLEEARVEKVSVREIRVETAITKKRFSRQTHRRIVAPDFQQSTEKLVPREQKYIDMMNERHDRKHETERVKRALSYMYNSTLDNLTVQQLKDIRTAMETALDQMHAVKITGEDY